MSITQENFLQVEKNIKSGKINPVYFLYGQEDLLIDELIATLQRSLSSKNSNQDIQIIYLYGNETSLEELVSQCSAYPMFAEHTFVVVKDFHKIKSTAKGIAIFENYLTKPLPSSTLVVTSSEITKKDLTKSVYKLLEPIAYEFPEYKYPSEFIHMQFQRLQKNITPEAIQLFSLYVSNSAREINHEIEKLILYTETNHQKEITENDIATVVGISKNYNVFTLQAELMNKNYRRSLGIALSILSQDNRKKEELFSMVNYFSTFFLRLLKLNQFTYQSMDDKTLAKEFGMFGPQAYFIKDYRLYAKAFSISRLEKILTKLQMIDTQLKGILHYISEDVLVIEFIDEVFAN